MKKLLTVLIIVLIMSGCDKEKVQRIIIRDDILFCEDNNGTWISELEQCKQYYTQEEVDLMFTDYGLDIHNVEDLVNLIDDMEDYITNLEQRIEELENIHLYKIHYFNNEQFIYVLYTNGIRQYNIQFFGGYGEIYEVIPYYEYDLDYTQEEFDVWWTNQIAMYEELLK